MEEPCPWYTITQLGESGDQALAMLSEPPVGQGGGEECCQVVYKGRRRFEGHCVCVCVCVCDEVCICL